MIVLLYYIVFGFWFTVLTAAIVEYQSPKQWPQTALGWVIFLVMGSILWPVTFGFGILGFIQYIQGRKQLNTFKRKTRAKNTRF